MRPCRGIPPVSAPGNGQLSAEQVRWAYRLLLGREPESAAVIEAHLAKSDRQALLRSFLTSPEFAISHPELAASAFSINRVDAPPIRVDVDATPQQLAQLLARVQACWSRLGREKPHWSVMSDDQFLPENIETSAQRFWDSGDHDLVRLRGVLARAGRKPRQDAVCVEYGCGLGRVTMKLAAVFGHVHAYDISPAHLEQAKARAAQLGLRNISFHLASKRPLETPQHCDVYYSNIVFQHNPPPIIARLIDGALAALKARGIAVFQVPTYIAGYHYDLAEYLARPQAGDAGFEIHCIPQPRVFAAARRARCSVLEVHEDGAAGNPGLCISNTFVMRKESRLETWTGGAA